MSLSHVQLDSRAAFDDPSCYTDFVTALDSPCDIAHEDFLSDKPLFPMLGLRREHAPDLCFDQAFKRIKQFTDQTPCMRIPEPMPMPMPLSQCTDKPLPLLEQCTMPMMHHSSMPMPMSMHHHHHHGIPTHPRPTIDVKIEVGLRGNGNRPFQKGCLTPPKMGKMRRITAEISSQGLHEAENQICHVRARTVDLNPGQHEGKLVLCKNDRCCTRKKSRAGLEFHCSERKTELVLPLTLGPNPCAIEFYLKPEWRGLGKTQKARPTFAVYIELVYGQTVYILLNWNVQLHSHKYESGEKAKALAKANINSTFQTSIYLE